MSKIITDKGCWIKSYQIFGYSYIHINGKRYRLNRIVAYLWHGMDLDDIKLVACHQCNNKPCFNPEHIYPGTYSDNLMDAVKSGDHGQVKRRLCKLGHELDGLKIRRSGLKERYCKKCQILANIRYRGY